MLTRTNRAIAFAAATAIALTAVSVTPASAGRRSDAAALAVFGAILGTVATIAIAEQRRQEWEHYQRNRAYQPGYYGAPRYFYRPYYRPY